MTFLDEEGHPRQFTWRTIQTWYYRYKNHGITGMTPRPRQDKGQVRKVTPEELLEAINAARSHFRDPRTNKRALYRFCIEKGLLHADRIAQTTFYRFICQYDLQTSSDDNNKKRLAFSMKYAKSSARGTVPGAWRSRHRQIRHQTGAAAPPRQPAPGRHRRPHPAHLHQHRQNPL
jgi:hypothetical protein